MQAPHHYLASTATNELMDSDSQEQDAISSLVQSTDDHFTPLNIVCDLPQNI